MNLSEIKNHKLYGIWSQVPVDYYQEGAKKNIFQWVWHTHKINIAKKLLRDLNFKNCLDVGCASGFMISEIAKSYPKASYFGIDVYDKAIDFAKNRYPYIQFQIAAADNLPFKKNKFEVILCYETIEHVENPLNCIMEIKRVLRDDGIIILAMDSGNWLFRLVWFIWEKTLGKVWKRAHLHPFNHFELERLIEKANCKIEKKLFTHLGMEVVFILKKQPT